MDVTDRIAQDYILQESWEGYKKYKQLKYRRSYTRNVYTRHLETGEEEGFFMTIVPSLNYTRNYSTRMRRNTYLHRDKYLSGYVLFHNLDGTFSNGWEYKDGEIVNRVLRPAQARALGFDMSKRLQLGRLSAAYQVELKLDEQPQIQTRSSGEAGEGYYEKELPDIVVVGSGGGGGSDDGGDDGLGSWGNPFGDGDNTGDNTGDEGNPVIGGGGGGSSHGGHEDNKSFQELEEHRNYDKILNDKTVTEALKNAWKEMLKNATEEGRKEVGAWIYYDPFETHKYYVGELKYGTSVSGGEHGTIDLGNSAPSENGVPRESVPLAPFHAHTTISHETGNVTKIVGPSDTDLKALSGNEFGFVIDYVGEKNSETGEYTLPAGHSDDLPVQIYVYNKDGVIKKNSIRTLNSRSNETVKYDFDFKLAYVCKRFFARQTIFVAGTTT